MAGVKGTLTLEEGALVFVPEGGRSTEAVLPVRSIARAHRARGTPVLEVRIDLPNAPSVIGFYFVQPPPLAQPGPGLRLRDRLTKRRAVIKLGVGSTTKRDEIELGPGQFFGELALISEDATRTARVRAKTELRCLALDRASFRTLVSEHPEVAASLLEVALGRLAENATPPG